MGHGVRPERQQIFTWVKSDKMSAICDRLGWISPCQLCETWEKKLHPKEDLMPGYNTQFELSVEDLDLIETALMRNKLALTQESLKKRPDIAPEGDERIGDVSNVVFSNGWIADADGQVFIYYASSDTRMHVATSTLDQLLDYVTQSPEDGLGSRRSVDAICQLIERNQQLVHAAVPSLA